jgi:hypothetical protein
VKKAKLYLEIRRSSIAMLDPSATLFVDVVAASFPEKHVSLD